MSESMAARSAGSPFLKDIHFTGSYKTAWSSALDGKGSGPICRVTYTVPDGRSMCKVVALTDANGRRENTITVNGVAIYSNSMWCPVYNSVSVNFCEMLTSGGRAFPVGVGDTVCVYASAWHQSSEENANCKSIGLYVMFY